jgi:serine protease Do
MKTRHKILSALAAVALLAAVSVILVALPRAETTPAATGTAQTGQAAAASVDLTTATASLESVQLSFREIAKRVLPVVVEVDVTETVTQAQGGTPFDFFGQNGQNGQGNQQQFQRSGLGSGIIVRQNGSTVYVLTNNHVVDSATDITVKLSDQRTFKGKVVGTDARRDLAVVSFESKEALPVAELGDSSTLEAGDLVLAVGNPYGFESSITMGIVSAVGRSGPEGQSQYTDYIQTDAAINQGNSGGALVNIHGQVIGINTWIAGSAAGGSVGLGFAVPINNAKQAVSDFITKGKVEYGWLGVQIGDLQDSTLYAGFAKDLKVEGQKGALVVAAYKGSPADKGGFLPGDYVVTVDSQTVKNRDHLTQIVGGLAAGSTHDFEVIRYGERMKLTVKIGARDAKDEVAPAKSLWPGLVLAKLTDELRSQASVAAGVKGLLVAAVTDPATPAGSAGFKAGDVIVSVNGTSAQNVMDYYKALNDTSKRNVSFAVNRAGKEMTIELPR